MVSPMNCASAREMYTVAAQLGHRIRHLEDLICRRALCPVFATVDFVGKLRGEQLNDMTLGS